jgi:UDP-2,4-diacetamido-2,4,6-trideoxy-beta-L-altropyranose hydrolase
MTGSEQKYFNRCCKLDSKEQNKALFFRADATTRIGTGHIMRCIAFAQAWQDQGREVTFLTHCESEPLRQRILAEGFDLVPIDYSHPNPSDLEQTLVAVTNRTNKTKPTNSTKPPWLVLDGYHFSPDYQKAIRDASIPLLIIDDMNHLPQYHADILLNQNINAPDLQYHCDPDTTLLLGTRYVLLRKEFLKYNDFKRQIPEKGKRILVTMGGADPDNVTLKVIEGIKLLNDATLDVKIIIGPSNPNAKIIHNSMLHAPCSMLSIFDAPDMPDLMAWADVAITAAGSTCWELAFMGVPMLTLALADNQQGIAEGLGVASVACNLGFSNLLSRDAIMKMLLDLANDGERLVKISANAKHLIDGRGAIRVTDQMMGKG